MSKEAFQAVLNYAQVLKEIEARLLAEGFDFKHGTITPPERTDP